MVCNWELALLQTVDILQNILVAVASYGLVVVDAAEILQDGYCQVSTDSKLNVAFREENDHVDQLKGKAEN